MTVPRVARAVVQTSAAVVTRQTINPLLGHCMYYAATECACFIKESHVRDMHAALTEIVQGLKAMQSQWEVGGTHRLHLLVPSDTMANFEQGSICHCWRKPRF